MTLSENTVKINPCPNPKCDGLNIRGEFRPPDVETDVRYQTAAVRCPVCNLTGPECNAGGAPAARNAIAAWNSISMGWINTKDKEPPKDGTMFFAVFGRDTETVSFTATHPNLSNGGWKVRDTEGYYLPDPDFWMPIPPTPEAT